MDQGSLLALDVKRVYLLLGSNLGPREKLLKDAIRLIEENIGAVHAQSAVYETAAWGLTDQPGFLNMALEVATSLPADQLMRRILEIEESLGRVRSLRWGARLIDIDVIFYGEDVIHLVDLLEVPHTEMHRRKFVLIPLAEINPTLIHPVLKQTIRQLLDDLKDPLEVKRTSLCL